MAQGHSWFTVAPAPPRAFLGITVSFCPHQKNKVELFYKLRLIMMELIDLRRQLLAGHLTQDQSRDIKRHITVRLDWGNE